MRAKPGDTTRTLNSPDLRSFAGGSCGILAHMFRKTKQVTIRDIAKKAGVANATVSNILNNSPLPYNRKTRERILKIARKLDYRPNMLAQSMRTRQTHVVGMVVPDLLGTYFSNLTYAVERRLEQEGYQVLLCQSHGDNGVHEKLIRVLQQRSVDGILAAVIDSKSHTLLYQKTYASRMPLVLYDSAVAGLDAAVPVVESDQPKLTRLAVEHLWELGHRDIYFLKGTPGVLNAQERLKGFVEAMRERGVTSPLDYTIKAGYHEEDGSRGLAALVASGKTFTAIVASSIFCGYGVLRKARELGWRVPENFSLVTIGGGREAERMGLTDVDQRPQEIGEKMAELLLEMMRRKEKPSVALGQDRAPDRVLHVRIEPGLQRRESSRHVRDQNPLPSRHEP